MDRGKCHLKQQPDIHTHAQSIYLLGTTRNRVKREKKGLCPTLQSSRPPAEKRDTPLSPPVNQDLESPLTNNSNGEFLNSGDAGADL